MIKTKKTANVSREFMPMPKIFLDTQVYFSVLLLFHILRKRIQMQTLQLVLIRLLSFKCLILKELCLQLNHLLSFLLNI